MSLWDKSEEECQKIIDAYFQNCEKTFGRKPEPQGIAMIVDQILNDKMIELTKSTFDDLTPQTLIQIGKMLMAPPAIVMADHQDANLLKEQLINNPPKNSKKGRKSDSLLK